MSDKMYNGYVEENDNEVINGCKDKPIYPTCRYCGKQTIPTAPYDNQAAADESATMMCDCYDARLYQAEAQRKDDRAKNVIRLTQKLDDFSEYCDARGVELQGDLHDLLLKNGIAVLDGVVASASIRFARMKVNISQNSKGAIIIGFIYSDGATVEV